MQNLRVDLVYFFRECRICLLLFRKTPLISFPVLPDHLAVFIAVKLAQIGFQINLETEIVHCFRLVIISGPPVFMCISIRTGIIVRCLFYGLAYPDLLADSPLFHRDRAGSRTTARSSLSILPYKILSRIHQCNTLHKTVFFSCISRLIIQACLHTHLFYRLVIRGRAHRITW